MKSKYLYLLVALLLSKTNLFANVHTAKVTDYHNQNFNHFLVHQDFNKNPDQYLKQIINNMNNVWFGNIYANFNAISLQGELNIHLLSNAMQSRLQMLFQNNRKKITKNNNVICAKINGIYFANTNLRLEYTGEFGNILYYRMGEKGFLYSSELNAWTSGIDLSSSRTVNNFSLWFRQLFSEIYDVYSNKQNFKSTLKDNKDNIATIVFESPTNKYDPSQKIQSIDESIYFWKHGKIELTFNKLKNQVSSIYFTNESQGISLKMVFNYNANDRPISIHINNYSKGSEGPMLINIQYDNSGMVTNINGNTKIRIGNINFNLNLNFLKNYNNNSIITIPPPTAEKRGRNEFTLALFASISKEIAELQAAGLGLRSIEPSKFKLRH